MLHAFGRTEPHDCVCACGRVSVCVCVCTRVCRYMHACASMLVSPCSMCMRLQPGRGVHPSPFLVSSFNSP